MMVYSAWRLILPFFYDAESMERKVLAKINRRLGALIASFVIGLGVLSTAILLAVRASGSHQFSYSAAFAPATTLIGCVIATSILLSFPYHRQRSKLMYLFFISFVYTMVLLGLELDGITSLSFVVVFTPISGLFAFYAFCIGVRILRATALLR